MRSWVLSLDFGFPVQQWAPFPPNYSSPLKSSDEVRCISVESSFPCRRVELLCQVLVYLSEDLSPHGSVGIMGTRPPLLK